MKLRKDASKTYCRDAAILNRRLRLLYHEAKARGTATDAQRMTLEGRLLDLTSLYPEKLRNRIALASGNLFTFLQHEGMEPVNNAAEREVRTVVIHRKMRDQIEAGAECDDSARCLPAYLPGERGRSTSIRNWIAS